jgi:hypothetical protein
MPVHQRGPDDRARFARIDLWHRQRRHWTVVSSDVAVRKAASPGAIARDFDHTLRRLIPHRRCRDTLGQPRPLAGFDGQRQVPRKVLTGCRRASRGALQGSRRRSRLEGRGGSGFHAAMTRAISRACRLSVIPGNRRRNSIAADNSPCCSYAVRIAAASASETTNISEAWWSGSGPASGSSDEQSFTLGSFLVVLRIDFAPHRHQAGKPAKCRRQWPPIRVIGLRVMAWRARRVVSRSTARNPA